MPSNHLILCHPLVLLPSILPSIRVFCKESVHHIRWPKYCSFSFSISPSNEYSGLIPLGLTGLISLHSKGLSRVFSNTTVQKHQFIGTQLSLESNSQPYMTTGKTIALTICSAEGPQLDPWVGKIPWRRERLPTPEFWPGEFHGLYSPRGRKESDTTEWLTSLNLKCEFQSHFTHYHQW